MSGFLPLILLIVIGAVVKAGQNQSKKDSSKKPVGVSKPQPVKYKTVAQKPAPAHSKQVAKSASFSGYFGMKDTAAASKLFAKKSVEIGTLKDDRKNDWLAQQLKEEQAVLRRREYLDLGAAHKNACAADLLKLYHTDNCDADGIDTGSYYK